jgi:hypothetical protein
MPEPQISTHTRAQAMVEVARLEKLLNEACECAQRLESTATEPSLALSGRIRACLDSLTAIQREIATQGR